MLLRVDEFNAARLKLTAEMADQSNTAKASASNREERRSRPFPFAAWLLPSGSLTPASGSQVPTLVVVFGIFSRVSPLADPRDQSGGRADFGRHKVDAWRIRAAVHAQRRVDGRVF